jgi:5S rRNA maturation endonuclease (ribonuclease M5)
MDDIIQAFPLVDAMKADGVKLSGTGPERDARCPFHDDKTASLRVNVVKQLWFCNACGVGGSIVDYLARKSGQSAEAVLRELREKMASSTPKTAPVAAYVYQDRFGNPVFRVLRFFPKTFRQQRWDGSTWNNGMESVTRILYRLPEILAAKAEVWTVEGEKDADNLVKLGFTATCNCGGAGKWIDGYTDTLDGRDVVLCGDNDEPGRKHMERVAAALEGKVAKLRLVKVPQPYKDISDFLTQFGALEPAREAVRKLLDTAAVLKEGFSVPILSMAEMEQNYRDYISKRGELGYSFNSWLPGLRLRPLVPGDVMTFVAGTGIGKTALLQNMAVRSSVPTLLFEMELADTLTFERFVACALGLPQDEVEEVYGTESWDQVNWRVVEALGRIYVCTASGLTIPQIEAIVKRAELKMGTRPVMVMIDYLQLVSASGKSRYEKMTEVASGLKTLAKNTQTIVVIASQVMRKEDPFSPVGIYDAKESGQIENSSGVMIGVWQDREDRTLLNLRVNKNTKGPVGKLVKCNFDAARMLITERSPIDPGDIP